MTAKITEGSLVSIGVVVLLCGALFTLAMSIAKGGENERAIARVEAKQSQYDAQISALNDKMSEIKGLLTAKGNK